MCPLNVWVTIWYICKNGCHGKRGCINWNMEWVGKRIRQERNKLNAGYKYI